MSMIFPTVDAVRNAINEFPPNKLEFYKDTGIHPQWLYNFMRNKERAGAPNYPAIVQLIKWLEEKHKVVFVDETTYRLQ